jgi:hypothetical protein
MNISRKDLDRAVSEGLISPEQAEVLWRYLEEWGAERGGFDLPHVAYYFGALVVVSAMTWFMTLGWEKFGGWGIAGISLAYAALFVGVGAILWRRGFRVPGGLLATLAVCMTPLVVYGVQRATGLWVGGDPGEYRDLYAWVRGGWFAMEVATVLAGLLALRFFRFPFLTAPVAFALWYMSLDLTPLIFGRSPAANDYQVVSLVFGLVMLLGAYLVDRRTEEDYAFWGYLFGLLAFWGGLTLLEGGSELDWAVYGIVNLGLMLLSVLLDRIAFLAFGAVGVFGYLGHLAWEVFEDSLLFPFALSAVGLAIIALGILYARSHRRIEERVLSLIPNGLKPLLPRERGS